MIFTLLPIIKKYSGPVLVVAVFALVIGSYAKGRMDEKNECVQKSVTKVITIREKQNEIRNNRPDDSTLIDVLRAGEF